MTLNEQIAQVKTDIHIRMTAESWEITGDFDEQATGQLVSLIETITRNANDAVAVASTAQMLAVALEVIAGTASVDPVLRAQAQGTLDLAGMFLRKRRIQSGELMAEHE